MRRRSFALGLVAGIATLLAVGSFCRGPADQVQIVADFAACDGGAMELGLLPDDGGPVTPLGVSTASCFALRRDMAERIHARCVYSTGPTAWVQAEYGVGECAP